MAIETTEVLLCRLYELIKPLVSDIHLVAGARLSIRSLGKVKACSENRLTNDLLMSLLQEWLSADQLSRLTLERDVDVRLSLDRLGEMRAHIAYQQHGLSIALRPLPNNFPSMAELHLPIMVESLLTQSQGLVLVVGATGSGKSTSLAAMIHHLNQHDAKHIITLEDPIERKHPSLQSLIQQREIGRDCLSFAEGLHAAMRQDPDVIMIGELRDLPSIRMALTASETGHLVLATLHAASACQAIDRLVDVFPSDEKNLIQSLLSQTLSAVLYQELTLSMQDDEQQRHALYELLIATPAVRNLIREGKTAQLPSLIQTGQNHGMQTLAQSQALWKLGCCKV